jgi:hypothetical protein
MCDVIRTLRIKLHLRCRRVQREIHMRKPTLFAAAVAALVLIGNRNVVWRQNIYCHRRTGWLSGLGGISRENGGVILLKTVNQHI